jgi:hypothetical protein
LLAAANVFAVADVAAPLCVGIAVGVGVVAGALVAGGALEVVGAGKALVGAAAVLDGTTELATELGADLAAADLTACGACATAIFAPSGATLPAL